MNLFIGCAVWAYKDWVGTLYPQGTRAADFLKIYSRRFSSVEGNTTFYAIPKQDTVTRWVQQTPPEFEFCLKLPRDITHNNLLSPKIPDALNFVNRVKPLADGKRLGPMFAQLPPSYSPTAIEDLRTFIEAWQQTGIELAIEVRNQNWFVEPHTTELTTLLEKFGVGRVLLDTRPIYNCEDNPQLHSERKKPQLPVHFSVTAPFSLIRFISHPNLLENQSYMEEWAIYIKKWLEEEKRIYLFIHCPQEEHSPRNACHFHEILGKTGIQIPPLPSWDDPDISPKQLSLW